MKPPPFEPALWAKTAPPAPPTPPLEDDVGADVVIIGAGYCGLSAALHLAEAGRSVVVVEAEQPGFGGSGRNAGHCVPDWAWREPDDIAAHFGTQRGERVNDMQAQAADLVFSLIRDHQISCDAVQSGTINVVRERKFVAQHKAKAAQWVRRGKKVRWIEGAEIRDYIGSDAFKSAMLFDDGGHLNPLAFCRGLAGAALKAGAVIHGKSPATAIARDGARWRVTTPGGTVTAATALMATNAHRHGLWPGLDDAYYIVRAVGAATEPLPEEVRRAVLPHDHNIQESYHLKHFFFFFDRAGRLVSGGHVGLGGNQSAEQITAVQGVELTQLFPALGKVDFTHYWQGMIDYSPDKIPGVHELAPGLFAAVGFSGRGVPTATAIGRELARMIIADDKDAMALPITPLPRAPFARIGTYWANTFVLPWHRLKSRFVA
jgi:glycine/D-amino acid oxidase-like deaminating enzyme